MSIAIIKTITTNINIPRKGDLGLAFLFGVPETIRIFMRKFKKLCP